MKKNEKMIGEKEAYLFEFTFTLMQKGMEFESDTESETSDPILSQADWIYNHHHNLPSKPERKCTDYVCYLPLSTTAYFKRIVLVYGHKFFWFLVISQFMIKGMLFRLVTASMLPIFKESNLSATTLQLFTTIAMSPWSVKPLVGVMSDVVPLYGYHKRTWILQSIAIGMIGGGLSVFGHRVGPLMLILCFVAINYEISVCDLLSEGKYAQIMKNNPRSGSDIITFVNGLQMAGTIVSMCFVGPLSDYKYFEAILLIGMTLTVAPLVPTILGWLPEVRRQVGELGLKKYNAWLWIDWKKWEENSQMIVIIAVAGLGGPLIAAITAFVPVVGRYIGMGLAVVLLTGCLMGAYRVFPRLIANVALYQVLVSVSRPSMASAMDYFFTADTECLMDGPHFTYVRMYSFQLRFLTIFLVLLYHLHGYVIVNIFVPSYFCFRNIGICCCLFVRVVVSDLDEWMAISNSFNRYCHSAFVRRYCRHDYRFEAQYCHGYSRQGLLHNGRGYFGICCRNVVLDSIICNNQ